MDNHSALQGVWLPLITPFRDSRLDLVSLRRLVRHFANEPIDGLILAATTGEGLTLDDAEVEALVSETDGALGQAARRLPAYLGLSRSDTRKVIKMMAATTAWQVDGYLIACPYYTRPSQQGLLRHFAALSDSTDRPIIIYNIPYRTGVNLGNAGDAGTCRTREYRGRQGLFGGCRTILRSVAPAAAWLRGTDR